MKISTKYDIGQEVWCCQLDAHNQIVLQKDKICEIYVDRKSKIKYLLKTIDDGIEEADIISIGENVALLEKIYELMKESDNE